MSQMSDLGTKDLYLTILMNEVSLVDQWPSDDDPNEWPASDPQVYLQQCLSQWLLFYSHL